MKFVLVLVSVLACASAQLGVKGGSSDYGIRSGSFFPRLSPAQGTKGRLSSSVALYGPSALVADDDDSAGRLSGQRGPYTPMTGTVQPSTRFLYDNRRPAQYVQYDATPMSTYPSYGRNYYSQPRMTTFQRVPTFASTGYGSGTYGQNALGGQYVTPTVVSRPAPLSSIAPLASYPAISSGYRSAPAVLSVPSVSDYALPLVSSVSSAPRTTPATVAPISGNIFTDNKISSPGFSTLQIQDRPGYGFASAPSARPVQSIPSTGYTVASVPSVSTGYSLPSVSSVALPTLSIRAPAPAPAPASADLPMGQVFSDNKISTPGSTPAIQSQLPVITQEKQFADVVQTTEW